MSSIKAIRKALGLTQAAFGDAIGCSQGNVAFYEAGTQALPVDRAEKLIEFAAPRGLRLTLDQVYGRKPIPVMKQKAKA